MTQGQDAPLAGQRVVVVGGTSGIGLAAVRAALRAGAEVIAAGRRAVAGRDAAGDGARLRHLAVDVGDEAAVRAAFEHIGRLDHLLVTAAPPAAARPFRDAEIADARAFVDGKLFGSWACARHAAPRLRPGGSITFLTGCAAIRPRAGLSIVTATFAALEALSQALALELGPVRVNTIRPGLVDTPMWDFLDDEARARLRRQAAATLPARRIGAADDLGHAAVFLMTNPYVTGAVLEVSGGEPLVHLDL